MQLTLSTGQVVVIKEFTTRKAQRDYENILWSDAEADPDTKKIVGVKVAHMNAANEALVCSFIETVDAKPLENKQEFIENLNKKDFKTLQEAIEKIREKENEEVKT